MFEAIGNFLMKHSEVVTLFLIALAVTMRKTLPPPLNRVAFLEWWYEWLRDALLTFISMRGPVTKEVEAQHSTERKVDPDGTVTTKTDATLNTTDAKKVE